MNTPRHNDHNDYDDVDFALLLFLGQRAFDIIDPPRTTDVEEVEDISLHDQERMLRSIWSKIREREENGTDYRNHTGSLDTNNGT